MQFGEQSGSFYPHIRTLTGLRDKHGICRGLTASEVFAMLKRAGIKPKMLDKPYKYVEFETDSWGFFTPMDTRDVLQAEEHGRFTYTITLPLGVLARLAITG